MTNGTTVVAGGQRGTEAWPSEWIIDPDSRVLVTGASGFIGRRVAEALLDHGFRNVRCMARSSTPSAALSGIGAGHEGSARLEWIRGNLLSREDCAAACRDVTVIYHLAAGRGEKSFPDAFANSVVTTRNLLEAARLCDSLKRFVNMSSFSVYSGMRGDRRQLDETCAIEAHPERSGSAYSFAKVKQDELVETYGKRYGIPYVIVRPGVVYGPGNEAIHGRVGISTFGIFLHLGGGNALPLSFVDNCAEAFVLAGVRGGVDGEVFNVVDDDLPSSRRFLRLYKENVKRFPSLYVPHAVSYVLCALWEEYAAWSHDQLPPVFNRQMWRGYWMKTRYSNAKLKDRLGWMPKVATRDALACYFESCRRKDRDA